MGQAASTTAAVSDDDKKNVHQTNQEEKQVKQEQEHDITIRKIRVFYISLNRTCLKLGQELKKELDAENQNQNQNQENNKISAELIDLTTYDHEDLLAQQNVANLFIIPSYQIESPVDSLLSFLEEARYDFRVSKGAFSTVYFSVLGVGHTEYGEDFCKQAQKIDTLIEQLGGKRFHGLGMADTASDPEFDFEEWKKQIFDMFKSTQMKLSKIDLKQPYLTPDNDEYYDEASATESDDYSDDDDQKSVVDQDDELSTTPPTSADDNNKENKEGKEEEKLTAKERAKAKLAAARQKQQQQKKNNNNKDDIEELGKSISAMKTSKAQEKAQGQQQGGDEEEEEEIDPISGPLAQPQVSVGDSSTTKKNVPAPKEMVSPMTRKALTKQGYALVGSHSAVKTCRWTKSAIRGRGYCYKHTFYGIDSARCMEATPSLACANKCSFCWRSHTNPVGTKWRWQMDDPDFVVDNSVNEHVRLVKQLAGVPGVRKDRFETAKVPRHAALSLVGEPIMYPQIRRYINLLHQRHISTFLVTNAQFPEALKDIPPVTQLYLSIDAATKDALKKIDRPLHRDFWERFLESIDILRKKKIRTVFRLTLVKDQNDDEIEAYADLIRRGQPSFIEVKGVTYCGYGGGSDLTIKNSPFHQDVVNFVSALVERVKDDYDIAAEHAHSCCVLAARKEFCVDGEWMTWIDYDRFFELVEAGEPFVASDYMAPLPSWGQFGSVEAGFSPDDVRFRKKKNKQQGEAQNNEE